MMDKVIKILVFCLIALFALAGIFFVTSLVLDYAKAPVIAQDSVNLLIDDVHKASQYYQVGTPQFSDLLKTNVSSRGNVVAATLSAGDNVYFAYPIFSPHMGKNAKGEPTITSSMLVNVKSKALDLNGRTYVLTLGLYTISPFSIYANMRIVFLMILFGTISAGAILLYLYIVEEKTKTEQEELSTQLKKDVSQEESDFVVADETYPNIPEEENPEDFQLSAGETVFEENALQEEAEQDDVVQEEHTLQENPDNCDDSQFVLKENVSNLTTEDEIVVERSMASEEIFTEQKVENNVPIQEESTEDFSEQYAETVSEKPQLDIQQTISEEEKQEQKPELSETVFEQEPKHVTDESLDEVSEQGSTQPKEVSGQHSDSPYGLFSPVTGFGWEEYLEDRLDSELIRSASSEEDITLMMIRIKDFDTESPNAQEFYDIILSYIQFKDMIFEYGKDGFSCIVHNMTIDAALKFAEEIYEQLSEKLKELGMDNEIGIGISTRSFRLIPAKRIFTEAQEALQRAFMDPDTPIVAFRVDPEKYRQYISDYTEPAE